MAEKRTKTIANTKTVAPKRVDCSRESREQEIAARAYERFVARGCEHGHDVEDWLAAEADVR